MAPVRARLPLQQERPKSAMFPGEGKVKMSVEEQIDRMRRHQSGSMKEKRRSLQLPASPAPDPSPRPSYKVVTSSQTPIGMAWHLPTQPTPMVWPAWAGEEGGRLDIREGGGGEDTSWAPR